LRNYNKMLSFGPSDYQSIFKIHSFPTEIIIKDHLGGFDAEFKNPVLDHISNTVTQKTTIVTYYIVNDQVRQNYPNLTFKIDTHQAQLFQQLSDYTIHPELSFKNFICSFNGHAHVSRKLLTAILNKFKYFNPEYCSKNFVHNTNTLDGHIFDYVGERNNFYRKFFITNNSEIFSQSKNSFGYNRYEHFANIYNLESKLTSSFLHIVSETMATNYHPFVTEKPFYSIVTRGLFVSYTQPGWHQHFEQYLGFKKYTKLFDYKFDAIQNPVERLVELITMISKFSTLSSDEWKDLYLIEMDTIEYNYNHYFSQDYLKSLAKYS